MTRKYILVSEKIWHDKLFLNLKKGIRGRWIRIWDKEALVKEKISIVNPDFIFIPHWSYMISKEVYENFNCVVFHMTDLPYGRGGSPLQNLIVRGFKKTKISSIKVTSEIDAGDIYIKKELSLNGTAKEIFERATIIIEEMIKEIISKNIKPIPQKGKVVKFIRRKPHESNIENLSSIDKVYDYIRMLDADGYPHAFLETKDMKIEFTNARLKNNKLIADARIIKK